MSFLDAYRKLLGDTIDIDDRVERLTKDEGDAVRRNLPRVWDALTEEEQDAAIQRALHRRILARMRQD